MSPLNLGVPCNVKGVSVVDTDLILVKSNYRNKDKLIINNIINLIIKLKIYPKSTNVILFELVLFT